MITELLEEAIDEIDAINFDHPCDWLDALKESAIDAVRENDGNMLSDDDQYCEMTASEHVDFIAAIKKEMFFHDQWDSLNLERRIVRLSKDYAGAWNDIINILLKYGVRKVSKNWLMEEPVEADVLIDEFCRYDLPEKAKVGGSWGLPKWYIDGCDNPDAPHWKFNYSEFTAYIKSVTATDNPDQVEVGYYIYRLNKAHCSGYYGLWTTGKAMVNTKTHRRWNVE